MAVKNNPVYNWTTPIDTLNTIKTDLLETVAKEEKWYRRLRITHGLTTRFFRFTAICLLGFGTIYPIFAKGQNLEWGYVCLAIGSLILLMDKYFGISTSFVRFYRAEIEIINYSRIFAEDWEIEMVKSDSNFSKDNILNLLNVAKRFRESVSTIIASETTAWATEFNAQISELQQELMKKESTYKVGNLSVILNNADDYANMVLSLDQAASMKLNGNTSAVFRNVSIAPHTVSFKGDKGNQKIEFSKNIDVTAEKTAELVFDLP